MKRVLTLAVVCLLLGGTAVAGGLQRSLEAPQRGDIAGFPGLRVASIADLQRAVAKGQTLAPETGNRPAVVLETDYYVYEGNDTPTLRLTLDPSGYRMPVSLYLYWENRANAERRYIANGSILEPGDVQDMFGRAGAPLAVWAPAFADLELFGPDGAYGDGPSLATGMYQFVLEVRDYTGSAVLARGNAMYAHVDDIVTVPGDITADTVWTNKNAYYLDKAPVYVGGNPLSGTPVPTTLTIEPGTFIFGSKANQGTLVVVRGSKLIANGTAMLPIVFTSESVIGERGPGDWGGLVLNGRAPINVTGGEANGEGNSGPYGGDDPSDSSGVLNYVRVEFAGIRFSELNELNGIAFQGVGSGTQCSNIQVIFNQDDGVEFFGGTVNCENLFLYNNEDDSVDWTEGFRGFLRNVVVIQNQPDADSGIEADNWENGFDNQPRSMPKIYNATFIGNREVSNGPGHGNRYRRGTGCISRNFIVMNFGGAGIRVDDAETIALFGDELQFTNGIIYGNASDFGGTDSAATRAWFEDPAALNRVVDPMLADPFNTLVPNVTPLPGSPARDAKYAGTSGYIGGVDPNAPWIYDGWTTFSDN
jgi:hypothetical protein